MIPISDALAIDHSQKYLLNRSRSIKTKSALTLVKVRLKRIENIDIILFIYNLRLKITLLP